MTLLKHKLCHVTLLIETLVSSHLRIKSKVFLMVYKTLHDQISASCTFSLVYCQIGLLVVCKPTMFCYLFQTVMHLSLTSMKFSKWYRKYHLITLYLLTLLSIHHHLKIACTFLFDISLPSRRLYKFHKSKDVLFCYCYTPFMKQCSGHTEIW